MNRLIKKTIITAAILAGTICIFFGAKFLKQYFAEKNHAYTSGESPRFLQSHFKVYENLELILEAEELYADQPLLPAHMITVRSDHGIHRFRLYFAESPHRAIIPDNATSISRHLHYFGNPSSKDYLLAGEEAHAFIRALLETHPYQVLTSFEKEPTEPFMYAFVILNIDGEERFLSDLLVENGWAGLLSRRAYLPYGDKAEDYAAYLQEKEDTARRQRLGIWQYSSNTERNVAGPRPLASP